VTNSRERKLLVFELEFKLDRASRIRRIILTFAFVFGMKSGCRLVVVVVDGGSMVQIRIGGRLIGLKADLDWIFGVLKYYLLR